MSSQSSEWLKEFIASVQNLSNYENKFLDELSTQNEVFFLNSNENFFIPLKFIREISYDVIKDNDPRIYPREEIIELERNLADYLKIRSSQVLLGNGSDQLIELITNSFLKSGDTALSIDPTFSIYEKCVKINNGFFLSVPLKKDFSLDIDQLLSLVYNKGTKPKLLFLCSPNNPTGNQFKYETIKNLIESFNGPVVIDEAYVDFAEYSLLNLINHYDNVIILRTFSKAFGLAGLRIGYCLSNEALITILKQKFQLPYVMNNIGVKIGIKMLESSSILNKFIPLLTRERNNTIKTLQEYEGVEVFDSQTNFVLFRTKNINSKIIQMGLWDYGIAVKNLGCILGENNYLRVTVAPDFMMKRFFDALSKVIVY